MRLFQGNGAYTQLISSSYSSTRFEDYERALVEFTPVEESNVSYQNIGLKVSLFNNGVVQTVTQRGEDYEIFKYLTNVVARTPAEAEVYANASTYAASAWSQQAMARVLGNASLFPGMCVDVYTANPKYYKDRYNGRWLIRGVTHSADRQQFQTQLALCRPSSSVGVEGGPYVPFWTQASKARPTMTLSEGQWVSSWTDPRVRNIL